MDPVSSLRFAVSPELRAARMPRPTENLARSAISPAELEKAAGSTSAQSASAATGPSSSFASTLGQLVSQVNEKQVAASQAVGGMLTGGNVSLHQAMISMEEANVSFQLMVEVRNKLLDSYQELMRMQI